MPTYGHNRPGAEPSEAIIENWWRQGMPATHADVIHADLLAFVRS